MLSDTDDYIYASELSLNAEVLAFIRQRLMIKLETVELEEGKGIPIGKTNQVIKRHFMNDYQVFV